LIDAIEGLEAVTKAEMLLSSFTAHSRASNEPEWGIVKKHPRKLKLHSQFVVVVQYTMCITIKN